MFQRIARRGNKAMEESNRIGKIDMSSRKLEIPREQIFHTKMREIKVRSL